jgi:cytochrome c5
MLETRSDERRYRENNRSDLVDDAPSGKREPNGQADQDIAKNASEKCFPERQGRFGGSTRRSAIQMNRGLTTTIAILSLAWPLTQGLAADADAGKVAYEKSCAGCHGADGKGNPAVAKTLQKSDEELLKIIAEGKGKMPASKKLTKEEQKAVLQYTRSLAK